jgi:hypothetical protein
MADRGGKWLWYLYAMLFVDYISVYKPIRYSPFYLIYSRHPILPIETEFSTWYILEWSQVKTRAELLYIYVQQLELLSKDIEEAIL